MIVLQPDLLKLHIWTAGEEYHNPEKNEFCKTAD